MNGDYYGIEKEWFKPATVHAADTMAYLRRQESLEAIFLTYYLSHVAYQHFPATKNIFMIIQRTLKT